MTGRRYGVVVRPRGRLLTMHVLHDPALVRPASALEADLREGASPPEELKLACTLIDSANGPLDWSRLRDDTSEKLTQLIEAKLECERRFMRDSVGRQTRRPCGVGRVEDEQASLAAVVLICWCRFWRLQRFSPSKYRPELADSRFGWGVRRAQVRGAFDGPVVHLVLGAN